VEPDMIGVTLIHSAINLVLLGILASPLLFMMRRRIKAKPWAALGLAAVLAVPVGACTYRQEMYAPLVTYSAPAASHWIRKAVEAPTRDERVMHVRRVALQSEYGGHIAWSAIRKLPDPKARCELYAIVADTPNVRSTGNVKEALQKECKD
jgi:hypothetical protein